ncbi:MAG: hypothetical protein R8J85_09995 [Mariprofundales bacterium]
MGMKWIEKGAAACLVAAFCMAQASHAQDFVEQGMSGSINWTTGEVHAKGIGVPPERYLKYPARARAMAVRAARVGALSNLLEQLQGVRVDAQTVVKDMAVDSQLIRTQASGVINHATMVGKPHYMEDGSVEVEMAVNYRQSLAPVVMAAIREKGQNHDADKKSVAPSKPQVDEVQSSTAITGLVIDARGLGMQPSMAPKVLAENGSVLFSALLAEGQPADGLVAYATSPDDANVRVKVGDHPMVIRAVKVRNFGDVVISEEKAKVLDETGGFSAVIRGAKVAIIL